LRLGALRPAVRVLELGDHREHVKSRTDIRLLAPANAGIRG
jgi:hypothetical protein